MSQLPIISEVKSKPQNIRELVYKLRDAVVLITGQIILNDDAGKSSLISLQGNGFFIKGHYIICPSSLILIRTDLLITHNRVPSYDRDINKLVRVSRILVDISNVNNSGQSYSYEADIVGVDGAANLAILRISTNSTWNTHNPVLRVCHSFLEWGKSRNTCSGDTIILIGDITAPISINTSYTPNYLPGSENAITLGILSDNRYVFPNGQVPGELLLLSNILPYGNHQGLPIINMDGSVIGMLIHIHNPNKIPYNVGLSEFFMRRPVKGLIRTYQDNAVPDRYLGFVEPVIDPIGNYYRFNKSWLGVKGILMNSQDYNTDIEKLIRIPSVENSDSSSKEIVGYRIISISQGITGSYTPETSLDSSRSTLISSPLNGIVYPGDIITHINDCPLGDRKGQISPSLVMWRVRPGDPIKITYKKQMDRFVQIHEITVHSNSYQPFLDFPFYSCIDGPDQNTFITLL